MPTCDSTPTTDLSGGPTPDEMYEMWLAARRLEWEAEDRRAYEKYRARANRPILEKALEDEALYGEAA